MFSCFIYSKIETLFYESKIRVNGAKLLKKSILVCFKIFTKINKNVYKFKYAFFLQLNENDEVDVIRGFSQSNPSHLIVSRIVILSTTEVDEGFRVNLRRYKSLLIENYSRENAYKSSETSTNQ